MRKRRKLLILLISIASLAALLVFLFYPRSPVPRYKGRTAVEWAEQLSMNPSPQEEYEAKFALRVMFSDRIPTLVAWLDYDPWPRRKSIYSTIHWLPASVRSALESGFLADQNELRAEAAHITLSALGRDLGPEIAPAMPRLAQLVSSTNEIISERAIEVASQLGTNGLAILLPVAADENHPRRYEALVAVDLMRYLDTKANSALPVLVKCTQSKDPKIVRVAAQALGRLKVDPAVSVPALAAILTNPDPKARAWAISALGRIGQPARTTLPALVKSLQDENVEPRMEATNALLSIAPEILTGSAPR